MSGWHQDYNDDDPHDLWDLVALVMLGAMFWAGFFWVLLR